MVLCCLQPSMISPIGSSTSLSSDIIVAPCSQLWCWSSQNCHHWTIGPLSYQGSHQQSFRTYQTTCSRLVTWGGSSASMCWVDSWVMFPLILLLQTQMSPSVNHHAILITTFLVPFDGMAGVYYLLFKSPWTQWLHCCQPFNFGTDEFLHQSIFYWFVCPNDSVCTALHTSRRSYCEMCCCSIMLPLRIETTSTMRFVSPWS